MLRSGSFGPSGVQQCHPTRVSVLTQKGEARIARYRFAVDVLEFYRRFYKKKKKEIYKRSAQVALRATYPH